MYGASCTSPAKKTHKLTTLKIAEENTWVQKISDGTTRASIPSAQEMKHNTQ